MDRNEVLLELVKLLLEWRVSGVLRATNVNEVENLILELSRKIK